jgi:mannose-6-phosphate isomerase
MPDNDTPLYPLLFQPIWRKKLWGGDRLVRLLGKPFPRDVQIGESWEISDYPGVETNVANGPLKDTSLRQLVEHRAAELVGDPAILQDGRFPLLVKYIDARETLSVQVHPGDDYAREHESSSGKKESWYILDAEPGASLIRGVTPGTTRDRFAAALRDGELQRCLHSFEPRPGDVVFIPWGMTHAIGAGILLAEIQQTSDVTYRTYDWNRVDPKTGEPRELHVEPALDVTDFDPPDADTVPRRRLDDGPCKRWETARCDRFVIEIVELSGSFDDAPPAGRFLILNVVGGAAVLKRGRQTTELPLGSSVLVPASAGAFSLRGDGATVLRSYVP